MADKSKVVFGFVKETPRYNVFEAPAGESIFGKVYVPKVEGQPAPTSLTVTLTPNA